MSAVSFDAATGESMQPWADTLFAVAEAAVDHGLTRGGLPEIDPGAYVAPLQMPRASFVTLRTADGSLRGCIGSLEPERPLVADVSRNAFAAAFRDPRFPPLTPAERRGVSCELSVLTPLERVAFETESELLDKLEPGRDGVLIVAGERRGTLLPQVWQELPEPAAFWRGVKHKAGLADGALPADTRVYRYRSEHLIQREQRGR